MMSVLAEQNARPEDVGEILVKVQEDLVQLKQKLLASGIADVDITAIKKAIEKTETGLQVSHELVNQKISTKIPYYSDASCRQIPVDATLIKNCSDGYNWYSAATGIRVSKSAVVLHQLNNQVHTLPSVEAFQRHGKDPNVGPPWDPQKNWRGRSAGQLQSSDTGRGGQTPAGVTLRRVPHALINEPIPMQGLTPGQMEKRAQRLKMIANPHNARNRETLDENYRIQLPLIEQRQAKTQTQVVNKGMTVEPLAVLPRANRVDAQLLPPPITEDDAKKGILSLIERGLIPPAAELTLDPSPVRQRLATLHNPQEKDNKKKETDNATQVAGYILDASYREGPPLSTADTKDSTTPSTHQSKKKPTSTSKASRAALQPLPPPTTPATGNDFKEKHHRFAIQHGATRETSAEFLAFKQHYCLSWGSIVSMVKHLERFLINYAVPIAFINGDKLADLSLEFELERPPTQEDLLSVIVNNEDVEGIIKRPGRRYMGADGRDKAASKIQALFKMYVARKDYLEHRRSRWASGVIAITWIMQVKMARARGALAQARITQLENFRQRAKVFAKNWPRICKSKRVIIHIPSRGHSRKLRETISDMNNFQNLQMGRLCDIKDPDVDVIYVSPVILSDEMSQYYSKLLGLKTAIDSGDAMDQGDLSSRYKIITPDALNSFPAHRMCLSSILKYSPKTLKRIKHLIRGREAYIVTGVPHEDDLYLSDYFDVPVLSPEPSVAHLYSTKSGAKRIFKSAGVQGPPGEHDIYSLPQLIEVLAQLITDNLEVTRWLFKIDDEFDGRGIAYIDVDQHLPCYRWAMREALRYGDKWTKKWAQEAAYLKIHSQLQQTLFCNAQPANTDVYTDWAVYIRAFLSQGGVIEACPPSDSVTMLAVDMLIEPSGEASVVSCGDQVHAGGYKCWGVSVPQCSIEPDKLNEVCSEVAKAAKERGIVGYFRIDLATFIHPRSMEQVLWALDVGFRYSDTMALFTVTQFLTDGTFDPKNHTFDIPPPKREEKKTQRRRANTEEEPPNTTRYVVMSAALHHTNLSVVHYSVFFQMCRAHGIGYDVKEKQGSVFTLVDGCERDNLGLVTIGDNLQGTLASFARNLSVIHQEISAPNMPGVSNYLAAIEDIEGILGETVLNLEEQN